MNALRKTTAYENETVPVSVYYDKDKLDALLMYQRKQTN